MSESRVNINKQLVTRYRANQFTLSSIDTVDSATLRVYHLTKFGDKVIVFPILY